MGGVAIKGCGNHTLVFGRQDSLSHDEVEVSREVWKKLESQYMSKSLMNKLYLKQKLHGLKMQEGSNLKQHVNAFD